MVGLTRGVAARGQVRAQLVLEEDSFVHQLEVVEEDALLLHGAAVRWRGAWRAPADIGVVAAACDEEENLLPRLVEDRRDDRHVRQVGAAVVGRVHHVDVARLERAAVRREHRANRLAHGAQVDRDVRRVGDQVALGIEHGAGEIQPLLDVHRVGGVLERDPHLLGDRHEEVVEHLQHHGVALGADGEGALQRDDAGEDQVALRREFRLPAGLDHRRRRLLADDRGAGNAVAGPHGVPVEDRRVVRAPIHVGLHDREARERVGRRRIGAVRLPRLRHHADALDRGGLHDQPLLRHDEAVVPVMRGLEAGRHLLRRAELDGVRRVAPVVADVRAAEDLDALVGDVLFAQLRLGLGGEIVERRREFRHERVVERGFDGLLPERPDVGEAHAVG